MYEFAKEFKKNWKILYNKQLKEYINKLTWDVDDLECNNINITHKRTKMKKLIWRL